MQLSNYLFFTTQCAPALAFYTQCELGRVVRESRYGEQHGAMQGMIMHSEFEGPGVHFFASDNHDAEPMRGSAMMFALTDLAQTERLFARLAHNGRITTPLAMQPWGDYFGKLTDQFGVQWMFNCTEPK